MYTSWWWFEAVSPTHSIVGRRMTGSFPINLLLYLFLLLISPPFPRPVCPSTCTYLVSCSLWNVKTSVLITSHSYHNFSPVYNYHGPVPRTYMIYPRRKIWSSISLTQ
ncbi:hypothetical protein F5B17DRAFT_327504 [Nemania serpens]|nr:hypothetical protein F5B17DRAFT_327504 [Nemania serpens]